MASKTKTGNQTTFVNQISVKHHMKYVLVPHKSNKYRPHLIRPHGLVVVLILVIGILGSYNFAKTGNFNVLGAASDISATELATDTNKERVKAGLGELAVNSALNQAAYAKAQDMFAANYWAHVSPTGVTPWKWLADQHYNYNAAGENLAKNYPNAQATVDAWMESPTHRENILKADYKEVGFAVADGILNGKNTTLIVAYYAEPVSGISLAPPATLASTVNIGPKSPIGYVGSLIQGLNPAVLGSLILLAIVGIVAGVAHHYRKKLPKSWQKSWRMHHGLYTIVGVLVLMVVIILGTNTGQI